MKFQTSRADGRSHREVLLAALADGTPGHTYTYDHLIEVLSVGMGRTLTRAEVQRIVGDAMSAISTDLQRTLRCVRGVGYRMAEASEHLPIAMDRKRRADTQMKRGLHTLQHVKWNELTPVQRELHQGTLLIVGAMYRQQKALTARQDRVEAALKDLRSKVDAISGTAG